MWKGISLSTRVALGDDTEGFILIIVYKKLSKIFEQS